MTAAGCARSHRALETLALAAAAALSLALLVRLGASAHPPGLRLAGAAAVLGYLAADLLSGLVHWILDTWGDEDTPVIGRGFIAPFREHHRDPASITRHDFIETNGNTAIPVVPVLGAACLIPLDTGPAVFAVAFVLCTSLGVLATNQIHKWAHAEGVPRLVRLLQRSRLILPASHHRRHHTPPFASHYCITNGWMNPLLAALDFHRRVERGVRAVRGMDAISSDDRRTEGPTPATAPARRPSSARRESPAASARPRARSAESGHLSSRRTAP